MKKYFEKLKAKVKKNLTVIGRILSGLCAVCGANDWIEYGYYGNHRCGKCGNKQ